MQERHVTCSGERFELPRPFFVLATQNPIEQEGTYPLPEAQLDRLMFLLRMTYTSRAAEIQILRQTTVNRAVAIAKVTTGPEIVALQHTVRDIPVSDHVLAYCTDLARHSRPEEPAASEFVKRNLNYGAGPRAGQFLVLAAKAWAGLDGRLNVCCDDVRRNAHAVFRHRVSCNFHAASEGIDVDRVIDHLLKTVPEPDAQ